VPTPQAARFSQDLCAGCIAHCTPRRTAGKTVQRTAHVQEDLPALRGAHGQAEPGSRDQPMEHGPVQGGFLALAPCRSVSGLSTDLGRWRLACSSARAVAVAFTSLRPPGCVFGAHLAPRTRRSRRFMSLEGAKVRCELFARRFALVGEADPERIPGWPASRRVRNRVVDTRACVARVRRRELTRARVPSVLKGPIFTGTAGRQTCCARICSLLRVVDDLLAGCLPGRSSVVAAAATAKSPHDHDDSAKENPGRDHRCPSRTHVLTIRHRAKSCAMFQHLPPPARLRLAGRARRSSPQSWW